MIDTPKTPEPTKAELFAQNPDRFVDSQDLIIAIMRSPEGSMLYLNPRSRLEIVATLGEVQVALTREAFVYDEKARALREKIVRPGTGGIINAARRGIFGK